MWGIQSTQATRDRVRVSVKVRVGFQVVVRALLCSVAIEPTRHSGQE